MQHLSAQATKSDRKEVIVQENECRVARRGERMIARGVLSDVVVAVHVPDLNFAALLRFSAPQEPQVSRDRLAVIWDFADTALTLLFQSLKSMNVSSDRISVYAIGGADINGRTFGRGKQTALAVRRSIWKQGISLRGDDLGGHQGRVVWLESADGRLIVRSTSPNLLPAVSQPVGVPKRQSVAC